jgi:hypothetical protein
MQPTYHKRVSTQRGDLKARVEQAGESLSPDAVNTLALDPRLLAELQETVESSLLRAHTRARVRARSEVEKARDDKKDNSK